MYGRIATMQPLDKNNWETIPNFINELRTNSLYRYIVEDMMARPGFVKKEHTVREDKNGQTFLSCIAFDTKESFDLYIGDEIAESIWTYVEITANQKGLSITIEDKEL